MLIIPDLLSLVQRLDCASRTQQQRIIPLCERNILDNHRLLQKLYIPVEPSKKINIVFTLLTIILTRLVTQSIEHPHHLLTVLKFGLPKKVQVVTDLDEVWLF